MCVSIKYLAPARCARALRHCAKIGRCGLTIIDRRWHAAVLVRRHGGMHRRMDDDICAFRQLFNLIGGRGEARGFQPIVAGIASYHHAADRGIDPIRCMTCDVCRANGAYPDLAGGPHDLLFVGRLECDDVENIGRTCRQSLLVFGNTLGDFAGLNEEISDMHHEFLAAQREAERRYGVFAANDIELRSRRVEIPAQLSDFGETFGMIRMHVREKHCIELTRHNANLR